MSQTWKRSSAGTSRAASAMRRKSTRLRYCIIVVLSVRGSEVVVAMLFGGDGADGCLLLRQPLEDLLVGLDASGQSVPEVRVCPTLLQVVSNRVADELGRRDAVHAGNELHVLGLV